MNTLQKIQSLNPETDYWEIARLSSLYEFSWDNARALEFALFRTFAVPSISKILDKSGEFGNRPQKRYDDTDLILSEILENGLESERGKAALSKLNFIHNHFKISNEDFLYVLTTFVIEPAKWIDKYGYRKLTIAEKIAGVKVWQEIGAGMGIQNIPEDLEGFQKYNREYEEQYFVFSETNQRVALATENLMLGWFLPKPLWEVAREFIHVFMDEPLLRATGGRKSSAIVSAIVSVSFALRKMALKVLPKRSKPLLRTKLERKETYPKGYTVEELGSIPYKKP